MNEQVAPLEGRDDGAGYEAPGRRVRQAREGHLRLIGPAGWAESVGGKPGIESKPGGATAMRAVVPPPGDNAAAQVPRAEPA